MPLSLAVTLVFAAAAADQAPVVIAPAKPKLICRTEEQELGSHIRPGRRCKTAEEWAAEDAKKAEIPPSMRVTAGQGDGAPHPTRPQ